MNIGRLKHQITIQRPDYENETVDSYGRRSTPWVDVARLYAQVADVSGREFYEAAAHQLQNTVTFTTRWVAGITTDMRIMFDGVAYAIDQVNHLSYRQDFLRIKAHAAASEGVQRSGQF